MNLSSSRIGRPQSVIPDPEALQRLAKARAASYRSADPFPHAIIDDLFDPEILDQILEEFPGPEDASWRRRNIVNEIKLDLFDEQRFGPTTWHFLAALNSATFLKFLEQLTSIEGLIADPYYIGGGLHQILPGGKLDVHIDFNKHDGLDLERRLNAIIYLNKDWDESWGGHLELWDKQVSRCAVRAAPVYNRMVVFSTTQSSFHGHPDPLKCPPDRTRRSLALYYYTSHRPQEEQADRHTTRFRRRPHDPYAIGAPQVEWAKSLAKSLIPPFLLGAYRAVRGRSTRRPGG
jgi:Rps23 Pro-64 3,4-dihydroxylase Tpa1-like proline 4-hydroxylase